jgi:dihydrofolate reductase
MRKIIASEFYTIDGLISDPDEKLEWVLNDFSKDVGEYEDSLYKDADTLLLGRITYKIFEEYWPSDAVPAEEADMANMINNYKKIVFSRTIDSVTWNNSVLMKKINPDEIKELKQQDGKNMLIIGSAQIVREFSRLGLIDEYHLLLHPVVLGAGKPLFNHFDKSQKLKLAETKTFTNGVVGLFYNQA